MTDSTAKPATHLPPELAAHDVPTVLGRLRVYSGGSGAPILFWASALMSAEMWDAQARHFLPKHQVVLVDPPGHGDSEPLKRVFTFDECAQCVVQILDALGIDRTYIVGSSWGGMIGGTFAARYPQRVRGAVLMNCSASTVGILQKIEYAIMPLPLRFIRKLPRPMQVFAQEAFVGPTTRTSRPQVVERIREAVERADMRSVRWAITSVVARRPDQHALFATIRAPVLVIAGEEDQTFSVYETGAMADAIPGAKLSVLKNTAHLAALENPVEVNKRIEEFISRNA